MLTLLTLRIFLMAVAAAGGPPPAPAVWIGTAWYPEQWPEARWDQDLRLMKAAGINVVRVGEFAWSRMEPREGKLDLDWLDRAIAAAARHGIATIIGTPTAAPPVWLTSKYPDTLRTKEDLRRAEHGNRQQFRFTSARYRQLARRIAEGLARRFGNHPNVVAWQIDNEIGAISVDEDTHGQFAAWLARRYRTVDALNAAWSTTYWSQTYQTFRQVPIPESPGEHHPSLKLAFKRFVTDVWVDYVANQTGAIRKASRAPITTNFMGWYDAFDHYPVSAGIDVASWDSYWPQAPMTAAAGLYHDVVRGFKRAPFWVMETQPGTVNGAPINSGLRKGEVRTMAWQAIGHGANMVNYWQWRGAPAGQEQYHGTLVGPDGNPRPVYEEIAQIGREVALADEALRDTVVSADVALVHSFESRWAVRWQKHHRDFDPVAHLRSYADELRRLVVALDVVPTDAPFDGYRVAVAPALNVIDDRTAQQLRAWVEAGGHLVLGARSGMKDAENALHAPLPPGPLAEALGAHVDEYYALAQPTPVAGKFGAGTANVWAERLVVDDPSTVEVLMRWGAANGWLDGKPAVVTRPLGRGRITYVGAWLDAQTTASVLRWALDGAKVARPFGTLPASLEVNRRIRPGAITYVLINHGDAAVTLKLPQRMNDVLRGRPGVSTVDLGARDVAVMSQ